MRTSRCAALLVTLLAVAIGAAGASADTVTKTVPAEYVFAHAQRPDDPGNCSAIIFAKWTDVPGTVSATAHYTSLSNGSWGERTETREAPFDDTYTWVATYVVPAGQHWIQLGKGWRDGPGVDDCSEASARQPAFYRTPVTVELTLQESAACVAAHKKVDTSTKSVASLKKQLKKASGKRRASLKKKLSSAKRALKTAQKNATKRCPAP